MKEAIIHARPAPHAIPPDAPAHAGARQWAGLALLALPTVLLGLDLTLLHLALPALAADLQPGSSEALWIMDAYGFMIAGFLVTMGTLGDRIGRRRLLLAGAAAFGLASLLAAFSTSAGMLIAARAALGLAGATLMPSTLALISNMFADPRERALAIGVWATMFALGMAAGPFLLPEYRAARSGRIDLGSVALSLAAMLPAVYGLKELARSGFAAGPVLAILAGVAAGVLFVRRQRRLESPLLDIGLFSNRAFNAALVILLVGLVGVGGIMLLITQYLQLVLGLSPLAAGAWMGPPALAMVAAGIGAPLLARRVRPGRVVAGALALSAAGYAMLAALGGPASGAGPVVAAFSLAYLGLGTIAALGTELVVGAAPPDKAGSASAMSETVQDLGAALGIAVLGSLATAAYRLRMEGRIPADLPADAATAVGDSLWAASSFGGVLPGSLLAEAQAAFTLGLNAAGAASAAATLALAVLAARTLRHVGTTGASAGGESAAPDCAQPG